MFVNPQQERLLIESPVASLKLGDSTIQASVTVRNLGVLLDSHLAGGSQVSATVRSCNFHLCQISRVCRYITNAACRLAVIALVISRLDYCNRLLAPAYLVDLVHRQVRDARLRQPSALQLATHRPRRKVGRAGFGVAGPIVWNNLPSSLRTIDSLPQFKTALKTHLWRIAYN